MTIPVTVAVHIGRSTAIRAGRNVWGWVQTTLNLSEMDEMERIALSLCEEHDGALRLSYESDIWVTVQHFASSSQGEIEATPEVAKRVLQRLVQERIQALEVAQKKALEIKENALSQIARLKDWLGSTPEQWIVEYPKERFGDRRFTVSQDIPLLKPPKSDEFASYSHNELEKEVNKIIDSAITEVQQLFASIEHEHGTKITAHHTAIQNEMVKRQQDFETKRKEVNEARCGQANDLSDARIRNSIAEGRAELKNWATARNLNKLVMALNDNNQGQISVLLRENAFALVSDVPRYTKITKTDILVENQGLASESVGLMAVFETAEDDPIDERQREVAISTLQRLWTAGVHAQMLVRVHKGQLTRRGQNVGTAVLRRSFLITITFGDIVVSREFALPE